MNSCKISSKTFCIVGGGGYVGWNLSKALLAQGNHVKLFDIRFPDKMDRYEGAEMIQGDITDLKALEAAFQHCDGVFHLAAYGMTGRESINEDLIYKVNVVGTENVISACSKMGVGRLVYASTTDVVWCNTLLIDGDENMPYLRPEQHVDNYGRTKTVAEKMVLENDGLKLEKPNAKSGENQLRTCALRFHGIYGAGEMRTTQRVITTIRDGMVVVLFSTDNNEPLIQYVSGENCVQSCLKSFEALGPDHQNIAGGQAYFIVDGPPVGVFTFWKPIFDYFDRRIPTFILPYNIMYFFAFIMELASRFLPVEPFITRKELNHSAITHSFSIEKAQKELNYRPEPADPGKCIEFYRQHCEAEYLNWKFTNRYQRVVGAWPLVLGIGLIVLWMLTHHWIISTFVMFAIAALVYKVVKYAFTSA